MRRFYRSLPLSLRFRLQALAYPPYECECCVGQEPWRGCYCDYHGLVGPGAEPEWWRRVLRKVIYK